MSLRPEAPLTRAQRLLAVAAICAPLLAPLHAPRLLHPDEGRYVEIGREMAASGDWLIPRIHGVPHWAKPPLTYWAIAASLEAFGATEWAARLPSAIAASLTLAATWLLARRIGGVRVSLLAVVMLATMLEFNVLGRTITADMMQTAFITWAAALAWAARTPRPTNGEAPSPRAILPSLAPFACLGVAFVAKGPVGLGVFFSALVVFLALRPRSTVLSWRHLVPGIAVSLVIGLPWFLIVSRLHPDLSAFFLGGEVRDRVLTSHGRGKGWWFMPVVLVAGTLPWTSAVFAAIGRAVTGLWRPRPGTVGTDDAGRYLLAWIAGPFFLFSVSGSKLFPYLLPLMPICAIAAARWVAALADVPGAARGWVASLAAAPALVAIGASIGAIAFFHAATVPVMAAAAGVTLASGVLLGMVGFGKGLRPSIAVCAAATLMLGWLWTAALLVNGSLDLHSHASHAWIREALAGQVVRGTPIGNFVRPSAEAPQGPPPTLVRYDLKAHTLDFYALALRPEFVPGYGMFEEWEIQSDQDAARLPTVEDLVALLDGPERVHVVTRARSRSEIEAAAGHPLRLVRSEGKGDYEVVLLANR